MIEKKIILSKYYEFIMAFLALIVSVIIVMEFTFEISDQMAEVFNILDTVILIVFTDDYIVRLFLAKDKLDFVKHNIIDLISIIPFSQIFQTARLLRLVRFAKLLKIFKLFGFLFIFYKRFEKLLKTNNFQYIVWITISTVIVGAVSISYVEKMTFQNALWWAFVTTTTVGYGDISPTTTLGRIIAVFLMLIGIGFIGMLTGTISTYFIGRREAKRTIRCEIVDNIVRKLDNFDELDTDEVDEICRILKALKDNEKSIDCQK